MSAVTADQGRSFSRTDTVQEPDVARRNERSAPRSRGGLRKPGTCRPRPRATRPRVRAAAANRTDVASMTAIFPRRCDSPLEPAPPTTEPPYPPQMIEL